MQTIFIKAVFVIAQEKSQCPSTEHINDGSFIQFYTRVRKNEFHPHIKTGMDLKNNTVS